jgi:hypothetical protein
MLTEYDRLQVADDTRSLFETHMQEKYTPEDLIDRATRAAELLIEMAGYDLQDSDNFGDEMGSTVKTLLIIVMTRVPQLADRINGEDEQIVIVQETP